MSKKIIVVSGFSSVGKGTLLEEYVKQNAQVEIAVSYTTREKRNELDKYVYVTQEEFYALKEQGGFYETNCFEGNYYGTPVADVERIMACGKVPILEIDINGYKQILEYGHFAKEEILSIFIAVEESVLVQRIINRVTEDNQRIGNGLETALAEYDAISLYDNVILNETKEKSLKKLEALIEHGERRTDDFDVDLFKEQAEKQGLVKLRIREWILCVAKAIQQTEDKELVRLKVREWTFSLDNEIQQMLHEEYGEMPENAFNEFIEQGADINRILEWFSGLNLIRQKVFILRRVFGIGPIRTYEEIAEKYKVTEGRIKQCELNALWKLRHKGIQRNRSKYSE